MDRLEKFREINPEAFERFDAIAEMNKALNRRRRLKTYERLKEVEKYKEKLYGKQK